MREWDERLGSSALIVENIMDARPTGQNTQLPLPDLLRRPFIVGWQDEDVNDAERRSQDPTFRLIGSEKI